MKQVIKVLKDLSKHQLSRKNKIRVYLRFFYWQLVRKHLKKQFSIDWVDNSKLNVTKGRACSTGNYYFGLLEFEEMGFWAHYLRETDNFIDIGANVGVYSVLGAIRGANGLAIEPAIDTYLLLEKNIQINQYEKKVEYLNVGLSDKEDKIYFTKELDSCNHFIENITIYDGEYEEVVVITGDTILAERDWKVNIIKIDVEGLEEKVIGGLKKTLEQIECNIVLCEVFGNEKLCESLKTYGFKMYSYNPFTRNLSEEDYAGVDNSIFIRDIEFAKKRVKESKPIRVYDWTI